MKNTFIVLTHTDADGHLAGYIATTYTTKDPFTEAKVFYYNYNGIPSDILELSDAEIKDSTLYITDLSICEEIKNLIKHFINKDCDKIIHIDHHTTSLSWIESEESKQFIKECEPKYRPFFDAKASAAYLVWVWSFLHSKPEVLKKFDEAGYDHVTDKWDFSDDRCFFKFNIYATEAEYEKADEYRVPDVVRYVSDNDIWEHKFPQSKQFATYYTALPKTSRGAFSSVWSEALNNPRKIMTFCMEGQKIAEIEENRSAMLREMIGYTYTFRGIDFFVMNECMGNSTIFGEEYDKHQAVCKWSYDGKEFTYTMYADTSKSDIDLSKIAEEYGGGGHKGAARFHTTEFLFGDIQKPKKKGFFSRLFSKKK